jgi:hypothetical protein
METKMESYDNGGMDRINDRLTHKGDDDMATSAARLTMKQSLENAKKRIKTKILILYRPLKCESQSNKINI